MAQGSDSQGVLPLPPRYKHTPSKRCESAFLSTVLAVLTLWFLHHESRWPGYWLEPVFVAVAGVNLWCGFLAIMGLTRSRAGDGLISTVKRLGYWGKAGEAPAGHLREALVYDQSVHPYYLSILAAWCLLTGALYSGAALSIDRVGLAGELLNCAALLGLLAL